MARRWWTMDDLKELIRLRDHHSRAEIAVKMNTSKAMVKKQLAVGRKIFKQSQP